MAELFVSDAVVRGLLCTKLATVAGLGGPAMVVLGEDEPDGAWCRLTRVRLVRRARQVGSGNPQIAELEASIVVVVPAGDIADNYLELDNARELVARTMCDARMADSPVTHEVVVTSVETDEGGETEDEQRRLVSGSVVCRGYVQGGTS